MSDTADRPTFVLGVGAMKAGTTWLHDHLAASPQSAAGGRKEWHVLDVVDLPSERWMRSRIAERMRRAAEQAGQGRRVDVALLQQGAMILDPESYPAHFARLLTDGARLSFDITPAYALLPAERFRWVQRSFDRLGVRACAVFLMRDPVDRLWSHLRMRGGRGDGASPTAATLLEVHAQPTYELRTRYELTLSALAAGFAPADVHVALYEQLFTPSSVEAISRFAGIEPHDARFDLRANPSPPETAPLPEDVVRRVAEHFAATYVAAATALPDVDLRAVWPSSRWVL